MIDPWHLEAYGKTTVNYNRDVEVFPVLNGIFKKTVATIDKEIGSFVGTEDNAFYSNKRFYKAMQTFDTLLQKRAASVLGQINGSIPSTWDAQKADLEKLINSDDINLSDLGGLMVIEKK